MRRERAEARSRELNAAEAGKPLPRARFYSFHLGRNRWIVKKQLDLGGRYSESEEFER